MLVILVFIMLSPYYGLVMIVRIKNLLLLPLVSLLTLMVLVPARRRHAPILKNAPAAKVVVVIKHVLLTLVLCPALLSKQIQTS